MSKQEQNDILTIEELRKQLRKFGDQAGVYAVPEKIILFDQEEGGRELGCIDTPTGKDKLT
mgnify:CR=1 FL=1